jgi:CSLREA domain-containing protein
MKRLAHICWLLGLLPVLFAVRPVALSTKPLAAGATYVVSSTADSSNADTSDGACADAMGRCTLRAAIMQANFNTGPDTIMVPSGVYQLTRAGLDDAALLGDLDITDDLTIQGAGSASTIVDGNGAVTGDRVFEVMSKAQATHLYGITIRNGQAASGGAGLLVHGHGLGSLLQLRDTILENNSSGFVGGGLAADYSSAAGSLDLENVVLRNNVADTNGGGLAVTLPLSGPYVGITIRNGQVYSNASTFDGGGIYVAGSGFPPISYSPGDLLIVNSQFFSNTAGLFGGGIDNFAGAFQLTVLDSHVHGNAADSFGGGILSGGSLDIARSTLQGNRALDGGAVFSTRANPTSNSATIVQSTLSDNFALNGGGLYLSSNETPTLTTLINSTFSGNTASQFGAGIYTEGDAQTQLFNSTVAGNQVVVPLFAGHGGMGGGLYVTQTAIITASNTLLADNDTRIGFNFPASDDCFGPLHSRGFSLIQAVDNCVLSGATSSNITGQDPLLGPLADNGGPTQTRALLVGSPAIDGGQRPCMDANGAAIPTDQRGFARFGGSSCDIGAFEYYPPGPFLPLLLR